MIETTHEGSETIYRSDNGKRASVKRNADGTYIVTISDPDKCVKRRCVSSSTAQEVIQKHLNAMTLQSFLLKYKGIVNHKGLAIAADRSVNYMSHVATGFRPSSPELNAATEAAIRELAKELIDISII